MRRPPTAFSICGAAKGIRLSVDHLTTKLHEGSGSTSDIVVHSQTDGDISVLQGSSLTLQVTVNQEMRNVTFVFESENGQTTAIDLQKSNAPTLEKATSEQWSFEIPNLGNGRFQVHLTSKAELKNQPLTNSFRPWYSFKWLPDATPIVEWTVTSKSLWRDPIRNANPSSTKRKAIERSYYWVIADSEIIELPARLLTTIPSKVSTMKSRSTRNHGNDCKPLKRWRLLSLFHSEGS